MFQQFFGLSLGRECDISLSVVLLSRLLTWNAWYATELFDMEIILVWCKTVLIAAMSLAQSFLKRR